MQLLLFDIDKTLLASKGAGRTAMARAFALRFGDGGVFESMQVDGRTDRALFTEALRHHGVEEPEIEPSFGLLRTSYLEILPETLAEKKGRVLDGVRELLTALPGEGVARGIATGNLREGASTKLRHYGLADAFIGGGYGDDAHDRVHVIEAAINEVAAAAGAAADPSSAVVIGDTPLDVDAAHRAGARAVAVATGSYSVAELEATGADEVLPNLSDTERALAAILRGL